MQENNITVFVLAQKKYKHKHVRKIKNWDASWELKDPAILEFDSHSGLQNRISWPLLYWFWPLWPCCLAVPLFKTISYTVTCGLISHHYISYLTLGIKVTASIVCTFFQFIFTSKHLEKIVLKWFLGVLIWSKTVTGRWYGKMYHLKWPKSLAVVKELKRRGWKKSLDRKSDTCKWEESTK